MSCDWLKIDIVLELCWRDRHGSGISFSDSLNCPMKYILESEHKILRRYNSKYTNIYTKVFKKL